MALATRLSTTNIIELNALVKRNLIILFALKRQNWALESMGKSFAIIPDADQPKKGSTALIVGNAFILYKYLLLL